MGSGRGKAGVGDRRGKAVLEGLRMEGVQDVTLPHDAEVTHHLKRREDRGCSGKWEREGGSGGQEREGSTRGTPDGGRTGCYTPPRCRSDAPPETEGRQGLYREVGEGRRERGDWRGKAVLEGLRMEGVLDVTLPHDAEVTHHLKRREDRGCTGKWEREGGSGGLEREGSTRGTPDGGRTGCYTPPRC